MKTMTCKQLGGACDEAFHAETFDEIAELAKQHGSQMYQQRDIAHLSAMVQMLPLKDDPTAMEEWLTEKRQEFDALPNL